MKRQSPRTVARQAPPSPETGARTILLVETDPYLAFLIRLHVPEAHVVEAGAHATAAEIRDAKPDLVLVGLESSHGMLGELLDSENPPKVIGIADGARAARTTIPSAFDGIVTRPFIPADLNRAVRGALDLETGAEDAGGTVAPALARARARVGPARIGAVAVAAVIEVANEVSNVRAAILALAFLYAAARWVLRRANVVAETADVAVACALIAATGGLSSPYMAFGLITAVAVGLARGPRWGALAALVIVTGSLPIVVQDVRAQAVAAREAVAWAAIFLLVAVTSGFASRVWRVPLQEGLSLLVEANRVLSSLYRIARALPGGLEIGSVADAAMQEIRESLRASAGVMLLSEAGTFAVVGSYGLRDPATVQVRSSTSGLGAAIYGAATILKREDFHLMNAAALGDYECWLAAPMKREGIPQGVLMAACPNHALHETNRLMLQRLADEAAVAVENARLFSRVREISIDEERRRLARELHDGVAQALTHLRYELDFMARHNASEPVMKEVQRLSRVVGRASDDVRSMIMGLRTSVSAEGLAGSLRSYLSDLRSLGGPDIVFEARTDARLKPEVEAEVFRVGQEAVSNALRHAGAQQIRVSLTSVGPTVRLTVEDDGIGLRRKRPAGKSETARAENGAAGGVGMGAMRERAELIGARLEVAEKVGGGTCVTLEYKGEEKA